MTEAQLRSWQPRRPAAGLKRKIFVVETPTPTAAWLWRGLAPAMACVMLTLTMVNHGDGGFGAKPVMAMILSNQNGTAYAPDESQIAQNHLAVVTFDWTNRSGFKSITGFTPTTNFSN